MDVIQSLSLPSRRPISCVEMHTTGEPTRIVLDGYPCLKGTLLEQRAKAKRSHDHIRKRLILEPRGHFDMYGAILRNETELTLSGQAHMGVLFMTNEGYSTMCGHATIALGRFLVDTHDKVIFPRRSQITYDPSARSASLLLHAPCGLLEVTVPTTEDGARSDPTRPVSFSSVPSFATGLQIQVPVPVDRSWPALGGRKFVTVDFSYGGAFFCIVPASELGFPEGLQNIDFPAMNQATRNLKAAVNMNPGLRHLFQHPDHNDLGFLFSVMVVDKVLGVAVDQSSGAETGLCYFANQQIDRSPTGSGVAARAALSYAKGTLQKGECRTYHSLVSNAWGGRGSFSGMVTQEIGAHRGIPIVRVQVSGYASYTGFATYIVEDEDPLQDNGFIFQQLSDKTGTSTQHSS